MRVSESTLFRSLLFVPSHDLRFMGSASRVNADILLLDLEDSVQPSTAKAVGRDNIVNWVSQGKFESKTLFVRINDRESGHLLKDLEALTIPGIAGFMYPKSYTGKDVYFIDKLLETIEFEKGLPVGTFSLIPLIETSEAVHNALEICQAASRTVAVAFGSEDFVADLEGIHDREHNSLFNPRALIAMAARAAKIIPIDTVHINIHDLEDLEVNLKLSKDLGFEGMLVLHPKELPLVHQYYSPTESEVNAASEIVAAFEEAKLQNKGVVIVNGRFIGPPIVRAAQKTLNKHRLISSNKVRE